MDMEDTVLAGLRRGWGDAREVHGTIRVPCVQEVHQLVSHLPPDGVLSLYSAPADVRGENGVAAARQDHGEALGQGPVLLGLLREDVGGEAREVPGLQRSLHRDQVHHPSSGQVQQDGPLVHPLDLCGSNQPNGLLRLRDVQTDHVRRHQQLPQRGQGSGCADRHHVGRVVEEDLHPHCLRENAELGPDVTIPHNPQDLAPHLQAALRGLRPHPVVHITDVVRNLPAERDDVGEGQLSHAPAVGERRVEHGHPKRLRGRKVCLVRADAEAPHRLEPLSRREHGMGQPSLRPNPNEMDIDDLFQKLCFAQCTGQGLHSEALLPKDVRRRRGNALQQQNPNFVLREGKLPLAVVPLSGGSRAVGTLRGVWGGFRPVRCEGFRPLRRRTVRHLPRLT
eukprot:RCo030242